MFVYNEKLRHPIKIWLENKEDLEESCLEQAIHLANLPFIHKWVALMQPKMSLFQTPLE